MFDYTKVIPFPRRRRASRCSNPMTPEIASKAKTMVLRLGMAQHVAAAKLGVNPGRISEALHDPRWSATPFAPLHSISEDK